MISRRKLRGLLDRSARLIGLTRWCEAQMLPGVTVLMYHRVLPDELALEYPFRSLAMPASAFASQVEWLSAHCEVMTMNEGLRSLAGSYSGRPRVAITFDDGYDDNAMLAAPLLEDAGLRGTFYITTDFVGDGIPLWFDRLAHAFANTTEVAMARAIERSTGLSGQRFAELSSWMSFAKSRSIEERHTLLDELPAARDSEAVLATCKPMTRAQLEAIRANGHEIGAHTRSHPILPGLTSEQLHDELKGSRERLESWLGESVTGFAYPNGDHDDGVVQAARDSGFEYACTTTSGIHRQEVDPMRVARIDVTRDRVFDASGQFDPLAFRSEVCRVRRFMRAS